MADHDKKEDEKKESFIDKIRKLIAAEPNTGNAEGTGGRTRRRAIDAIIDDAVGFADDDARRSK